MLLSIFLLASSLVLLCKIFLAVGIDHLFINPFLFYILIFSIKVFYFLHTFPCQIFTPKWFNLVQLFFFIFLMISFRCLYLSGVRRLLIKFVNWFVFDFIASIPCPLGSSHSLKKLNFIGFSMSVFPQTTAFSHMFLQLSELQLHCHAFPSLLLFQVPHEIFFQIIHPHCCLFPLHHSFIFLAWFFQGSLYKSSLGSESLSLNSE